METILLFVGVVGNVISVLVFASPIKTFVRIVKNRSTEEFDPSPYVFTLLGSSLWVYYGITKPGGLLVATVNGVGVVLETIYLSLFLIYATPSRRVKAAAMVSILNVGFLGVVISVTRFAVRSESLRIWLIGGISACLNVFMYGSPLAVLKTVITTRSVEYMPFLLSFFLFLNGGIWALYAALDCDLFLGIPNGIGFILGAIQLILYMIYMNSKVSKHSEETTKDECHHLLDGPTPTTENEQDEETGISAEL